MLLLARLLTRSVARACTPFASSASAHVAQRGAQREPRRIARGLPFLVAVASRRTSKQRAHAHQRIA
eukprot:4726055-Pleurochrysis_carterae.AAC.1